MAEHISKRSTCDPCNEPIEFVDGIKDPFWRHVRAADHPAKPRR